MLYRLIIKKEIGNYFLAKSFSNKYYLVEKNEFIKKFSKGADVSIYAHKCKGILFNVLTPISDEEADVVYYN